MEYVEEEANLLWALGEAEKGAAAAVAAGDEQVSWMWA